MGMTDVNTFVKKYSEAISQGNAAVFAGAGMSVASGFADWRGLLRDIAEDLGLDVDKEIDLLAVAQYHVNKYNNRHEINQKIIQKFTESTKASTIHQILTELPIDTYWTTNYDTLIEDTLKAANKLVEVKKSVNDLALNLNRRDAVVYKMHGDVCLPDEAVITKDDYEAYNEKKLLFSTALQGDLVSKTFLFIGFSFTDPNLNYILGRIRILLGINQRTHYAFFKSLQEKDYPNRSDFEYDKNRQKLFFEDLKRYAISPVLISEYSEIPEILGRIKRKIDFRNIFISGSADDYSENGWTNDTAVALIENLVSSLIKNDYKIITGFGKGIGSFIINSAVKTINEYKHAHYDDYMHINPFPFQLTGDERAQFNTNYRDRLLSGSGIAIFMFGNKTINGKIEIADGVLEEFRIAREKGLYVIPIGSTGYAGKVISQEIIKDIKMYVYLEKEINTLSTATDINIITKSVMSIIKEIERRL
jgi:hypothetical protein